MMLGAILAVLLKVEALISVVSSVVLVNFAIITALSVSCNVAALFRGV
jgi:hypothetical protein